MMPTAVVGAAATGVVALLLWRSADRVASRERAAALARSQRRAAVGSESRLERLLSRAAVSCSPLEAMQVWALAGVAVALLIVPFDARLGMLGLVAVVGGGPLLLWLRRHRRTLEAAAALPDLLRLVASELRIGGTVSSAFATAATSERPFAGDAAILQRRMQLGAAFETAVVLWSDEHDTVGCRAASGALVCAANVGGPAADALDGLAASLAERFDSQHELRAQSSQARASALVMVCAPLGYLVFSASIDQRSLDALFGTVVGRVCLAVGLALDALAWIWIRFLVREQVPL